MLVDWLITRVWCSCHAIWLPKVSNVSLRGSIKTLDVLNSIYTKVKMYTSRNTNEKFSTQTKWLNKSLIQDVLEFLSWCFLFPQNMCNSPISIPHIHFINWTKLWFRCIIIVQRVIGNDVPNKLQPTLSMNPPANQKQMKALLLYNQEIVSLFATEVGPIYLFNLRHLYYNLR
jgi:hypothetical protein